MKTMILLSLLVLDLTACTKNKPVHSNDSVVIYTIVDITDPHELLPQTISILSLYNFTGNPNRGGVFTETYISDKLLNPDYRCEIAQGEITERHNNRNDRHYRENLIRAFYDSATTTNSYLKNTCDTTSQLNSECFSTISKELNALIKENSTEKILLIYSNLFENTETFSCYNKECLKLLEGYPDSVATLLNQLHPLPSSLEGVRVYFIYKPATRQDDALYAKVNNIYRKLLEQRHAKVFTQAQNNSFKL